MVVLAAAVLTGSTANKSSKVILSRQYVDMSRIRIEGLLAALPRLMTAGQQHTFIETEGVRYLWQPFESMLLVLVTNKGSNIVEDLETLRMMGMIMTDLVVPDEQGGTGVRTEHDVADAAFDIMFAFDELLSMGYRNHLTVEGVLTALDMKSQEEEHAREIEIKMVQKAKKKLKEEAQRINQANKERRRRAEEGGMYEEEVIPKPAHTHVVEDSPSQSPRAEEPPPQAPSRRPATGMKIGGLKKGKKDGMAAVLEEDGVEAPPTGARPPPRQHRDPARTAESFGEEPTTDIKEQITASFDADGNMLEAPKVKGSLSLTVPNAEYSFFEVSFDMKKLDKRNFDLRPHPKLDPKTFDAKSVLRSKPENKTPFPTGQAMQILKWGLRPNRQFDVPISLSIWGDEDNILVQYELSDMSKTFVNAVIRIPALAGGTVDEVDECQYFPDEQQFVWRVPSISSENPQAGVNITWDSPVQVADIQPLTIEFQSPSPLAGAVVQGVLPVGPGAEWLRRRMLCMVAARRSTVLGKVNQEDPSVIRAIADFL